MESQLFYCLNPKCSQNNSRVNFQDASQSLHSTCIPWVISEQQIKTSACNFIPFDPNKHLKFTSKPIQTQEYILTHEKVINKSIISLSQKLRFEVLSQLDQFDHHIKNNILKWFSYSTCYSKIRTLSKSEELSVKKKSTNLNKILQQPFPTLQDVRLPQLQDIDKIIQTFNQSLVKLFQIKTSQNNPSRQADIKIEDINNESNESTKSIICMKLQPSAHKMKLKKQMQEIWEYASKHCNLNTAQILMGQSMHKFYEYCEKQKTGKIQCSYCDFSLEAKAPKRTVGNSTCAFSIIQHICSKHPMEIRQNYDISRGKIYSVFLSSILEQISSPKISSVGIFDSYSLGRARRLQIEEADIMFEVCYNQVKPRYCKTFMKGGEPRECMALLGYISCYIGIYLNKRLIIYTSNHKKQALVAFLQFYKIPNITIISSPQPIYGEKLEYKRDLQTLPKKGCFL